MTNIRRMGETGTVPAVPPLWAGKEPGSYEMEVRYVGNYPVSPIFDIKLSIYMAETRAFPKSMYEGDTSRNKEEAITREQSLKALTINVARAWHQESRMGSIEFGKIANMTVYDCDFLHDDIEKVAEANLIATVVDGVEVYKG